MSPFIRFTSEVDILHSVVQSLTPHSPLSVEYVTGTSLVKPPVLTLFSQALVPRWMGQHAESCLFILLQHLLPKLPHVFGARSSQISANFWREEAGRKTPLARRGCSACAASLAAAPLGTGGTSQPEHIVRSLSEPSFSCTIQSSESAAPPMRSSS